MRYLVIHKSRRHQDELVSQIKGKALSFESTLFRVREYGPLLGWLLSFFHISFKAIDNHGKAIWLNRHQFCELLLHSTKRKAQKELHISSKDLQKLSAARSIEIDQVYTLFHRQVKEISYSHPEDAPDLNALYETLDHELSQIIDRLK